MSHRVTHPSKEQVRAYMAARESARRPPPAPDEIRRQLGWRLHLDEVDPPFDFYLIPTEYTQILIRLSLTWMLAPLYKAYCSPYTL